MSTEGIAEGDASAVPAVPAVPVEHWQAVRGFPGLEASAAGRIRSRKTRRLKIPLLNRLGTPCVPVRCDASPTSTSRIRVVSVANLVAAAFLPGFDDRIHSIEHIDRDRTNNALDNIRCAAKTVPYNYPRPLRPNRPNHQLSERLAALDLQDS